MTDDMMDLRALVEKSADTDLLRELVEVRDRSGEVHDLGRVLGARYGFPVDDAMIVAAALLAGRSTLLSEDMQHGMVEGFLRIENPFREP